MKQVVQNYKSGELTLLDVAEPACKPGGVLVRTRYSLISTGTEMMKVGEASMGRGLSAWRVLARVVAVRRYRRR